MYKPDFEKGDYLTTQIKKDLYKSFQQYKFLLDHTNVINFIEGRIFKFTGCYWDYTELCPKLSFYSKSGISQEEAEDFVILVTEMYEFALIESPYEGRLYWNSYKPSTLRDGTKVQFTFKVGDEIPKYFVPVVHREESRYSPPWTSTTYKCAR